MQVANKIITIKSRQEEIDIICLADLHLASKSFAEKELDEAVKFIKDSPNCYWFGLGDLGECINFKDEKRFDQETIREDYANKLHKYHQLELEELKHKFKPIAKQCLALIEGNHEYELKRRYNFDLTWGLLNYFNGECGADVINGGDTLYYVLSIHRKPQHSNDIARRRYDFMLAHGHGGARTPAGKINKVEEMRKIFPNADFYLMGHQHEAILRKPSALFVGNDWRVSEKTQYLVAVPSFCKVYEEGSSNYASRKLYPPTSIGFVTIRLWAHRDKPKEEVII